jgi:hypothetical protein
MFEQLMDLIKQNAGEAVINNPAVPNEHNDAVVSEAGNSIIGGLKNMISQGNVQDVVNLFQHQGGNIAATPAGQQLSGGFIQNLMDKFGLSQGAASGVASNLIPQVLQKLVHKTNDPSDSSFNIQDIVSHLGGGGAAGGGFDLQGLIGKFTQGGNTGGNAGGEGILDTIKGVFNR